LVSPLVSFPQVFPPNPCTQLYPPPIRATCISHLILLDLITRTIMGEVYRSLSSSLWSFIHSPFALSLSDPNIFTCNLKPCDTHLFCKRENGWPWEIGFPVMNWCQRYEMQSC
jgi:hypothetical protein